jgi:hypothetical protein
LAGRGTLEHAVRRVRVARLELEAAVLVPERGEVMAGHVSLPRSSEASGRDAGLATDGA